ncbi:hypothetical protein DFH27DRAFT_223089 [Peziza echinospora]|nr:hypothetical protein DFH27DRAFT_223089 [Peziza echinospora]
MGYEDAYGEIVWEMAGYSCYILYGAFLFFLVTIDRSMECFFFSFSFFTFLFLLLSGQYCRFFFLWLGTYSFFFCHLFKYHTRVSIFFAF